MKGSNVLKFALLLVCGWSYAGEREEKLLRDDQVVWERCLRIAKQFYDLGEEEEIKEITAAVLASGDTKAAIKERIVATGRRFFLFRYPSGGLQVKGTISFVPDFSGKSLLVFLRGGNRMFGLVHPANDISCVRDYTVLSTAYRGGVSEGMDQFGGDDVDDVENLVAFLPTLQQKLGKKFNAGRVFILGGSRGGMQMFLALGRSMQLQGYVAKAASLSGLLDMRECVGDREDMKTMFIRDFGLIPGENEEAWISRRDPLDTVAELRKDLPFLIVQGTEDLRVGLKEGNNMVERLRQNGNPVTYLEISGGDHCLANQPDRMEWIADWFEKGSCVR